MESTSNPCVIIMPILEILWNKGLSNNDNEDDDEDEEDKDDNDENGGAADIDDGPVVLAHVELAQTVCKCVIVLFLFMIFT